MNALPFLPAIGLLIAGILGIAGQNLFAWIAILITAILMLALGIVR